MNPVISATLNQQMMSGAACGQQGMLAESQGNAMAAAQCYDQAIGWIQQSMLTAQQWGTFVPDGVFAALANAHASAARVKNLLGYPPIAWQHLSQALGCLNQAIAQNPCMAVYHSAAGTLLMSMNNLPDARRAFSAVQQLQPGDPYSMQMLNLLQGMQARAPAPPNWVGMQPMAGSAAMGAAMGAAQPLTMGMPGTQATSGSSDHADWMETVKKTCSMLDSVFKTAGGINDMMGKFD